MIDLTTLLAVGVAFWVVAASPGPANISNAAVAMRYGRRASLIYGAGLSTALCIWGLLAATGMGALLQTSVAALFAMKMLGGAYLLWLAWQSGKSARRADISVVQDIAAGRWFWRGVMLNLSNPKSVIAWLAALSMGLDPGATIGSVVLTTLVCIAIAIFNNVSYSLVFSIGGVMVAYRRARRWIDGVTAGLFALAGVGLVRSAFTR